MSEEREAGELRPWFEDAEQQRHAAQLGMWLFLTSEVLLFGALFGLYTAYRLSYGEAFAEAAKHNDVLIGTANTAILITSSFSVAWGIHSTRIGRRRMSVASLLVTVGLAAGFLLLKGIEYSDHIRHGILPGAFYQFAELPGHGAGLFFTLYFFMTGLHALHVVGGMAAITITAALVARGTIRRDHATALENVGLYWHLVDAVWIFLWPILYLVK